MIYIEDRVSCIANTLQEIFELDKVDKRFMRYIREGFAREDKLSNVFYYLVVEYRDNVYLRKKDIKNVVEYCNMICDFANSYSTGNKDLQIKNSDLHNMESLIKYYNKASESLNLRRSASKLCSEIDDFFPKYKTSMKNLISTAEELKKLKKNSNNSNDIEEEVDVEENPDDEFWK